MAEKMSEKMADDSNLYPPIDDVPLRPMPMPSPQAPPYNAAQPPPYNPQQAPPYNTPQAPPHQMPLMGQLPLGPTPTPVTCPACGASVVTVIRVEPGMQTHLIALGLCLLCACLACIPYFSDSCQNANHHCPNCNAFLGTYKR